MAFINRETFILNDGEENKGTVEVTIRKETRRVSARRGMDGLISAYGGISGRYKSGSKAWPAKISEWKAHSGEICESVFFGRDDRNSKFKKENCIYFAGPSA